MQETSVRSLGQKAPGGENGNPLQEIFTTQGFPALQVDSLPLATWGALEQIT